MTAKHSIQVQISEVKRELALRKNVYALRVNSGKMRGSEADLLIEKMQSVLATLELVEAHAEEFRALLKKGRAV